VQDVTSLNPADIWATYGMTLADVYDSLGHEGARQFLHSPYTARLPGGEALKDVVRRLEPFVVDLLERQKAPVVVVSHLGTLQVRSSIALSLSRIRNPVPRDADFIFLRTHLLVNKSITTVELYLCPIRIS
jgi:broad specificity phosphatase PhoE